MMRSLSAVKNELIWTVVGLCLLVTGGLRAHPTPAVHTVLYAPSDLKYFTLGYDLMTSDVLWLRVLQDFDLCDQVTAEQKQLPGHARCNRGWVYSMIDAVTELDPKFKIAHVSGADILSIAVDDREGAARIYEKAVLRFPYDPQIPHRAAYHYMVEMNNPERAAQLLTEAGRRGAPSWVFSLAARLYTKQGRLDLAESVLQNAIKDAQTGEFKEYIIKREKEVRERLQAEKGN